MIDNDAYAVMIGKQIAEMLERRGQTQASLAAKLGISRAAVNKWVNGIVTPSPLNISKIAAAIGCSTDFLLPSAECADTVDDPAKTITESLDKLSKQQINAVAEVVKSMLS